MTKANAEGSVTRRVWLRATAGAFLGGGVLLLGAAPASAHSCAKAVTIAPGKETEVQVGVTVAEAPLAITLQFSPELVVKQPGEVPSLTVEHQGQQVQYQGNIHADQCMLLPVTVRATGGGTYRVRALQSLPDGSVAEHPADGDVYVQPDGSTLLVNHEGPPNPAFEQVVYVKGGGGASSAPIFLLLGTFLVTIVAVAVLARKPRKSKGSSKPTDVATGP
jgi:hypothetical protein